MTPQPWRCSYFNVSKIAGLTLSHIILGESYESLKFLYCISAQSIGCIIPETCQAIIDALSDEYMKVSINKNDTRY